MPRKKARWLKIFLSLSLPPFLAPSLAPALCLCKAQDKRERMHAGSSFLSLSLTHTHIHIHKPRQGQVLWVVSKYCWCQCCPHVRIVLQHVETADSYDLSFVSLSPSLDFFLCLSPSLPPSLATLSPSRVLLRSISSTLSYSKALFLSPCPLPSLSPLWHSLCTRSLTEGASGSSTRC